MTKPLFWFAFIAAPQREYVAARLLEQRFGAQTYIPTETRWRRKNRHCKSKTQIAFAAVPRYVLAGFKAPPPWLNALDMPCVTGVLNRDGNPIVLDRKTAIMDAAGRPIRLTPGMLNRFMASIPNGKLTDGEIVTDAMSPSEEQFMRTHREFAAGDVVDIVDGPFRDRRVEVLSISGKRANVEFDLLGETKQIAIPIHHLEKAA